MILRIFTNVKYTVTVSHLSVLDLQRNSTIRVVHSMMVLIKMSPQIRVDGDSLVMQSGLKDTVTEILNTAQQVQFK